MTDSDLEEDRQSGPNQLGKTVHIALDNPKFLAVQEHPQAAIRIFGQNTGFLGLGGLGFGLGSFI